MWFVSFVLFIDETDVFILSPLCQEYQIDWLIDRIRRHISICTTSKSNTLLEYLLIADRIGFNLEERLTNQISEPFPILQTYTEFSQLNRRTQILIARKCLWKLLMDKIEASIADHILVSIFKKLGQKLLREALSQDAITLQRNLDSLNRLLQVPDNGVLVLKKKSNFGKGFRMKKLQ